MEQVLHRRCIWCPNCGPRRSVYLEAAQKVYFDLGLMICDTRGAVVFYTKGTIPTKEGVTRNDVVNSIEDRIWDNQFKVEDGPNDITHTIGQTKNFDFSGRSPDGRFMHLKIHT